MADGLRERIKEARKQGFSSGQIVDTLNEVVGFKVQEARKAGFSDDDILPEVAREYSRFEVGRVGSAVGGFAQGVSTLGTSVAIAGGAIQREFEQTLRERDIFIEKVRNRLAKEQLKPRGERQRLTQIEREVRDEISVGKDALTSLDETVGGEIAQGLRRLTERTFPTNPLFQEELGQRVAAGLGQFGSQLAIAALTGGSSSFVQALVGGGIGAIQQGALAYEEAVNAGADQDTAAVVGLFNAGIGTTEIIPILGALGRFNRPARSAFLRVMKRAAIVGTEEALQEVGATIFSNEVAKHTFDPDRQLLEGARAAGEAGGVVGGIIGGAIGLLDGRRAPAGPPITQRKAEQILGITPQGSPTPPIAPPVTPPPPPTAGTTTLPTKTRFDIDKETPKPGETKGFTITPLQKPRTRLVKTEVKKVQEIEVDGSDLNIKLDSEVIAGLKPRAIIALRQYQAVEKQLQREGSEQRKLILNKQAVGLAKELFTAGVPFTIIRPDGAQKSIEGWSNFRIQPLHNDVGAGVTSEGFSVDVVRSTAEDFTHALVTAKPVSTLYSLDTIEGVDSAQQGVTLRSVLTELGFIKSTSLEGIAGSGTRTTQTDVWVKKPTRAKALQAVERYLDLLPDNISSSAVGLVGGIDPIVDDIITAITGAPVVNKQTVIVRRKDAEDIDSIDFQKNLEEGALWKITPFLRRRHDNVRAFSFADVEVDKIPNSFVEKITVHVSSFKQKNQVEELTRAIVKELNYLLDTFLPGRKVTVILADSIDTRGLFTAGPRPDTFYIALNVNPATYTSLDVMSTLYHEVGHAISQQEFAHAPKALRLGIYKEWVDVVTKSALSEVGNPLPFKGMEPLLRNVRRAGDKEFDHTYMNTWFNFEEYMAESFARYYQERLVKSTAPTQNWFASTLETLKNYYKIVMKRLKEQFGVEKLVPDALREFFDILEDNNAALKNAPGVVAEAIPFTSRVLEAKVESQIENAEILGEVFDPESSPPAILMDPKFNPPGMKRAVAGMAKFGWFQRIFLNLWQIQEQNPGVAGLKNYLDLVRSSEMKRGQWISRADERVKQLRSLGADGIERLSKFVFFIDRMGYLQEGEKARWPTDQELLDLVNRFKLTELELQTYMGMRGDFLAVLNDLEQASLTQARKIFAEQDIKLAETEVEIEKEFKAIRGRPYFPHERFGKWILIEKDESGKKVSVEAFERKRDVDIALAIGAQGGNTLEVRLLTDKLIGMTGIPTVLLKQIRNISTLTPKEVEMIEDLIFSMSAENAFAKKFRKRKDISGFSTDILRAYGSYFLRAGGHIARVLYNDDMDSAIRDTLASTRGSTGTNFIEQRTKIAEYMQAHKDYLYDPGSEWDGIKSLAFFWYLGFAVDSAVVNLTQVPMVTAPFLSARFGALSAIGELKSAYRVVGRDRFNITNLTPDEKDALALGTTQLFLRESQAAELAGVAEGGALGKFTANSRITRLFHSITEMAATPFRLVENANRDVSFLAAYRLAKKNSNAPAVISVVREQGKEYTDLLAEGWRPELAAAFLFGKHSVQRTQFEFSRWARPAFMRGKVGSLFVFWNFKQNLLYFLSQDPSRAQALLVLMATAGLMGLPGFEDINDIIKAVSGKIFGKFFDPELEARKTIIELVGEENGSVFGDLLFNGPSRYGFGVSWLLSQAGLDVPTVDLSGRLGIGRVVPGVQSLTTPGLKPEARVVNTLQEIIGAGYNIPLSMVLALDSGSPDAVKQFEQLLPRAVKNAARAVRWANRGEETTRSGAQVIEFNVDDAEGIAELALSGLGFQSSRVAQTWDEIRAERQLAAYWIGRRSILLEQLNWAREQKDLPSVARIKERIVRFNKNVPERKLKITRETLSRSFKARKARQLELEKGRNKFGRSADRVFPLSQASGEGER